MYLTLLQVWFIFFSFYLQQINENGEINKSCKLLFGRGTLVDTKIRNWLKTFSGLSPVKWGYSFFFSGDSARYCIMYQCVLCNDVRSGRIPPNKEGTSSASSFDADQTRKKYWPVTNHLSPSLSLSLSLSIYIYQLYIYIYIYIPAQAYDLPWWHVDCRLIIEG